MSEDVWAREMFSPAGYAPEPDWTPDAPGLLQAGRRRNRRRRAAASGSLVGIATAAVLGSVLWSPDAHHVPPAPAATPTPAVDPSDLDGYVSVDAEKFVNTQLGMTGSGAGTVPLAAARTLATLVARLDPAHAHLRSASPSKMHLVNDDDRLATNIAQLLADSRWASDGSAGGAAGPHGDLGITFADSASVLHPTQSHDQHTDLAPCGTERPLLEQFQFTRPGLATPGQPPKPGTRVASWSGCTFRALPDGSKVETASLKVGAGTVIAAIREFPAAGSITVLASDFAMADADATDPPAASAVLAPSPWSETKLADALSDPGVTAGLPPQSTQPPAGALRTADLADGWVYAPDRLDQAGDRLPVDNFGCGDPQNIVRATTIGFSSAYTGSLPGGDTAWVTEDSYPLQHGQASSVMASLRANAGKSCAEKAYDITVRTLPSGTGDAAFVRGWPGGQEVYVQVGDTVLVIRVTDTAQTTGPQSPLSPTDQDWLTRMAKLAATRAAAAGNG